MYVSVADYPSTFSVWVVIQTVDVGEAVISSLKVIAVYGEARQNASPTELFVEAENASRKEPYDEQVNESEIPKVIVDGVAIAPVIVHELRVQLCVAVKHPASLAHPASSLPPSACSTPLFSSASPFLLAPASSPPLPAHASLPSRFAPAPSPPA